MEWRDIGSAPDIGEFLVADYSPTSRTYLVRHVKLTERHREHPRHRETALRYCRAWMPLPAPPKE